MWEADRLNTGPGIVKRHGAIDVNWDDPRNTGGSGQPGPPGPAGPAGPPGADSTVPGPQGPAGEGFDYKGDWINGAAYIVNDVVRYSGSTYICTAPLSSSTTPPPASGWELFTAQGDQGATGPGVAADGTTGQYLRKASAVDYATAWDTLDIADVNGLQAALDAKQPIPGAWTTYTPTWTAFTTNPSIGNGSITGEYLKIGSLVFYRIAMSFGTTTTFGSGAYWVSLPVETKAGFTVLGSVRIYDASAGTLFTGMVDNGDGTTKATLRVFGSAGTYVNIANLTETIPVAWGSGDDLRITGYYEAAA